MLNLIHYIKFIKRSLKCTLLDIQKYHFTSQMLGINVILIFELGKYIFNSSYITSIAIF